MVLNICLMVQVARAAQNHARTGAFVPPSEKRVMNVTAPGLATPGRTAPRVSVNASEGETNFAELVFLVVSYSFSGLRLSSRVPHMDQSVPEAVAQHGPLPAYPLQGFLEHHQ